MQVIDFPGTSSMTEISYEFKKLSQMANIVLFLSEFRGNPEKPTVEEYKSICKLSPGCPVLVCLTQVWRSLYMWHC